MGVCSRHQDFSKAPPNDFGGRQSGELVGIKLILMGD